jgi:hypothetical protein
MKKEEAKQLKKTMLAAKNANQLKSLIIDYHYQEIILTYDRLSQEDKHRIKLIWLQEA